MSTKPRSAAQVVRTAVDRLLVDPTLGVISLLVLFALVALVALPVFFAGNNIYNLVGASITVMILSIGMTVVLISGGIDLSVGAVMALCAGVAATVIKMGAPLAGAFIVAIVVGILVGLVNGLLITRVGLPDFIATLAMMGFASGLLYIATQGVPIIGYMTAEYSVIGGLQPLIGLFTFPMLIALVLAIVVGWVLARTRLGAHFFAVGSNAVAARQSGVPVRWVKTQAYVLSGACAAIAGIILAGRNNNVPADLGTGYEIQAISAGARRQLSSTAIAPILPQASMTVRNGAPSVSSSAIRSPGAIPRASIQRARLVTRASSSAHVRRCVPSTVARRWAYRCAQLASSVSRLKSRGCIALASLARACAAISVFAKGAQCRDQARSAHSCGSARAPRKARGRKRSSRNAGSCSAASARSPRSA
mgnify:CR=1 FL=1